MTNIPVISVVVTVFTSEKIIPTLIKRIDSAMCSKNINYELILINDANTDNSKDILQNYNCKKIIVINNEKNLGQAYTCIKGIERAEGQYIVTIDDDLEYEPIDILKLYHKIEEENSDVVFGLACDKYKKNKENQPFWRN